MKSTFSFALNFYVPFLIFALLIFIVLADPKFVDTTSSIEVNTEISVLGIKIPLPVKLEKAWLLKGFLIAASLSCLTRAFTINFTKYFPRRFQVNVYFKIAGIKQRLKIFSANELAAAGLAEDWERHIVLYDKKVSEGLIQRWQQQQEDKANVLELTRDSLHAHGYTDFEAKRVGLFSYRIVKSSGLLKCNMEVPDKSYRPFSTVFSLLETSENLALPRLCGQRMCECVS